MSMRDLADWFWPILALILAGLWIWALFWQRRRDPGSGAARSEFLEHPVEVEDAVKAAHALQDKEGAWTGEQLAEAVGLSRAMAKEMVRALVAFGWASQGTQGHIHLTETGQARAQELVRAHRLWETYLVDEKSTPLEAVHAEAHRREHETAPEEVEEMDAALGYPAWDPHGHAIPAAGSQVPSLEAPSLFEEAAEGSRLRIICLDDESEPLLAQLVVMGLRPGETIKVLERKPDSLRLELDRDIVLIAAAAAQHVCVVPVPISPVPLGGLAVGRRARVTDVRGDGRHQRRMLDMGLVPGARVAVIRAAPLGDPVEYRIKGTAVAMRRTDADSILVEEIEDG